MVSPLLAAAIVSRSDPVPLSALFSTVSVLGTVRASSTSSLGRNGRRWPGAFWRRGDLPWFRLEPRVRQRNREGNSMACVSNRDRSTGKGRGIGPSAQTERRGDVEPVRDVPGGETSAAARLFRNSGASLKEH